MTSLDLVLNPLALLYDVRLGSDGIEFILFRVLVVATVPFANIESVEAQKSSFRPWSAYRFVNRWVTQRFVISKKSAWFSKHVVVSPANSEMFEDGLRQRGVSLS